MPLPAVPSLGNTSWRAYMVSMQAAQQASYGQIVVASSEAPAAVKDAADFVCDGTADQVQFNAAMQLAAALQARSSISGARQGGTVQATGGRFDCNGSILMETGVTFQGLGALTEIRPVGLTAVTGSGGSAGLIKLANANTHLCHVTNMWLAGNSASGGACNGIDFQGDTGNQNAYPASDPDACNIVDKMFINMFSGVGTRHGVRIAGTNNRGAQISDMWEMRIFSGDAIFIDGAPDGIMNNIHIGGAQRDGVRLDGGNWKVFGVKSFYCDGYGFNFLNSRMVGACIEAQDCETGINFGGADVNVEGVLVDNCNVNGIVIGASRIKTSFSVLHRGSGRYPDMNVGVLFSGTPTALNVQGTVNPGGGAGTIITTPVSGTYTGAANFVRIGHGSTLVTRG